ncbi:MAG: hypothetical protein OD811_07010 [Alphaproteobacteria bacterium]
MKNSGEKSGDGNSPQGLPAAVLLYGPNQGLVRERARLLIGAATGGVDDPFVLSRLSALSFADRARGGGCSWMKSAPCPLAGGQRTLWLEGDGETCSPALLGAVKFLDARLTAGEALPFMVCEAGALRKNAALVRGFATAKSGAVVPCYEDDARSHNLLIGEYFEGLNRETREALAHHLPTERALARRALEKLRLHHVSESGELSAETVSLLLTDDGVADSEDFAYAFASGNKSALTAQLSRHRDRKTESILLLRAAARHTLRLGEVATLLEEGRSLEEAMRSLRPPVFWKREKEFRRQAKARSAASRRATLAQLLAAESVLKSAPVPNEAYTAQILWRAATGLSGL